MLLLGPIFILLEQFILLPKFKDEGIEFLVIDLNALKLEDFGFELVDNDVFLVVFDLGYLVGSDCCLGVIKVFAVHFSPSV